MSAHAPTHHGQVFLRFPQVAAKTGLCRSSLYAMAARGEFPAPVKIGKRASAWLLSDIEQWQQQRIEAARGEVVRHD
ncbi:helix-turn-helix transcriptional regulator [Thiohalocapsa marina]|uniref:helix-turn-helix transcriptional regulator n=1 Tax=Thiohalocapsa marina TaxID=424902 RepID=UPI0036DB7C2A